jgi:uncharacterized protein YndB with AHSA1/START domain
MTTTTTTTPDRIEKQIRLRHPRARVWRALTDSREFGRWFGAVFDDPFRPGATVRGKITEPGYEHLVMELVIERMEEERVFAWRWHPGAPGPGEDFSNEPTTLVTFELEDAPGGTLLTVVESGFDRIPLARRASAFGMNQEGWAEQARRIERYLDRSA